MKAKGKPVMLASFKAQFAVEHRINIRAASIQQAAKQFAQKHGNAVLARLFNPKTGEEVLLNS